MPYMKTAQEWLGHSHQLLEARPTTTRITTKYTLKPLKELSTDKENTTTSVQPPQARAVLTLKTYETVTGVTLKYKTDKAAEVGRLITILSMLGRNMAGLPKMAEDVDMLNAPVENLAKATPETLAPSEVGSKISEGQGVTGNGQGTSGKKNKKKGKR